MTDATPLDSLLNRVHCLDCFDLMARLPDKSIDAIISDLPYGTTSCHWDTIIPFAPMWDAVKRILKPRGVFVTTASQPFTSALVMSNPGWFRYEWIWEKSMATGFLNAPHMPLRAHDNLLIFSEGLHTFNPEMTMGLPYKATTGTKPRDTIRDKTIGGVRCINTGTRHPRTVLKFSNDIGLHPTQKPVALYDYLIRTYTQPGEIVLDFCAGSGTTALAARQTGRRFIIGDSSPDYCAIAQKRLDAPYTLPMMELLEG